MSISAMLFGRNSLIFKATNILGLGIPGWLDKTFGVPEQEGLALGELAQQTAKEAEPRTIVWGRVRPIGGNIIHCQEPKKKWVKVKSNSGGKGGGGGDDTVKEQHVFRTYAIGVCEGPITAFSRIWRNNKLVYDARGNAWGTKNNPVFLKKARLYLGKWDQARDPTLQSIWGVDIPAYRGTAYMVIINEDLTDLGGSVPQYIFEVERAEGKFVTSRPYSIEIIDGLDFSAASVKEAPNFSLTEAVDSSVLAVDSGSLRDAIQVYDRYLPEGTDMSTLTIISGSLKSMIETFSVPPEAVDVSSLSIADGFLKNTVRTYDNYLPEAIDATALTIISGTLA